MSSEIENPTGLGTPTNSLSDEEKYHLIESILLATQWTKKLTNVPRSHALAIIRAIMTGRKIRMVVGSRFLSMLRTNDPKTHQLILREYVILHHDRFSRYDTRRKLEGEIGFNWFS